MRKSRLAAAETASALSLSRTARQGIRPAQILVFKRVKIGWQGFDMYAAILV